MEPRPWVGTGCTGLCRRCSFNVGLNAVGFCEVCWSRYESKRTDEVKQREFLRSKAVGKICLDCGVIFIEDPLGDNSISQRASEHLKGLKFEIVSSSVYDMMAECLLCGAKLFQAADFIEWSALAKNAEAVRREIESRPPPPPTMEERLEALEAKLAGA